MQNLTKETNLVLNTSGEIDSRKFIVWNAESSQEVLSNLQISRISVENQKKVFEHPLESGAVIADHEIIEAKRANIQAYISVDDRQTLTELESLYLNGTSLKIRAENRILNNMTISSQPVEITSSMLDKNLYNISFKEAQFASVQYVKMPAAKKASNTSRVNTGVSQGEEENRSLLHKAIFRKK